MAFPIVLADLESAILDACAAEDEWPARIAAGVYAGVDYAVANPELGATLAADAPAGSERLGRYENVIGRLTGFLRAVAPVEPRLPAATDEALVAGMIGLVGDHLRIGRIERLEELRPELVLLTLLPYLGFAEAKSWADKVERSN
jgi:hypothetical protein